MSRNAKVEQHNGHVASAHQNGIVTAMNTPVALRTWSCEYKQLPEINSIKAIHVYDFDNTLFCSPLPNRQIWDSQTVGRLQGQDVFTDGGWWHDPNVLTKTGKGVALEEPKAWEGWWSEHIVELVLLSMQQKDALTILLTGRSNDGFREIVTKIVKSRNLEFDMIVLKPTGSKYPSTMKFKQAFLTELINTYHEADEIRVYEDRPRHVEGFRDFFSALNNSMTVAGNTERSTSQTTLPRQRPIKTDVIEVAEKATTLDPVTEIAEVQRMVNVHNEKLSTSQRTANRNGKLWHISQSVLYTGYLISPADTERLLTFAGLPLKNSPESDVRPLANCILSTTRPLPKDILDKAGPLGKTVRWRVNGVGTLDNKLWAARVLPIPENENIITETKPPCVVLALHYSARPFDANRINKWQDLDARQCLEFSTTLGEKMLLRLDEANMPVNGIMNDSVSSKRGRETYETDFPSLGSSATEQKSQASQRSAAFRGRATSVHRGNSNSNSARARGTNSVPNRGAGRSGPARGGYQRPMPYNVPASNRGGNGRGRAGLSVHAARGRGAFGADGANDHTPGLSY